MRIRAATYNIYHCENFLSGKIQFDNFALLIKSLDADIIGLNEVHGKGEDSEYTAQTEILASKTGYSGFFAKATDIDGANPFGNAVLTRLPIRKAEVIPIPDPEIKTGDDIYETRCLLKLEIAEPELTVLITHFGLNGDEQHNAVETVLANLKDERCILMGDLNVEPGNPVLLPIKERMNDTAAGMGELYSFWANDPDRKIDYIFTSRDIRTVSFEIPDKVLSDHLPVVAELEI